MASPTPETQVLIDSNWQRARDMVAEACIAAGRDPGEVTIVGVAKYVGPELTAQLVRAGCSTVGENRPQTLWQKHEWFDTQAHNGLGQPKWHMIGHLQTNKVRRTLPLVDMIQSVDSLKLAIEINREAARLGRVMPILLDVNLTQDSTKTGMTTEQLPEVLQGLSGLENVSVCGLMAMSSLNADVADVRREFAAARELQRRLAAEYQVCGSWSQLSMGMSEDFREAIIEGSTCVRLGTLLWAGVL
ncbi:MAG: YggS family pyridoxal phosphate-dependent enzyme [Pirellulaceae bacterium]|nr:YggS family pyridoxal phosphate-dependent enzyme [Pirellulaceae bacterium]